MNVINATGRRKRAIARAYLSEGKGNITVNNREFTEYFPLKQFQTIVTKALDITELKGKYDVKLTIKGGGVTGQAEAVSLAISRSLLKIDPELRKTLKDEGLLRRDSRVVERKKPGRKKARKNFQFSKR